MPNLTGLPQPPAGLEFRLKSYLDKVKVAIDVLAGAYDKRTSQYVSFDDLKLFGIDQAAIERYLALNNPSTLIEYYEKGNRWVDYNIDLTALPNGASAPDLVALNGGTILVYAFDGGATTEQLFGKLEINHDWAEGTNIIPHIHWLPTTAAVGNVKWNLTYSWTDLSTAEPVATTISVVTATAGSAWFNQQSAFPEIPHEGRKVGSQFCFRLWRNPSDAQDTYTADAAIKTLGIHAQVDSFGSRKVVQK